MLSNPSASHDVAELRRLAEERLRLRHSAGDPARTSAETARLVQELEIHQIELEMQNEELRRSHADSETLLAQYTDLYEFAPSGYFNIDREGLVRRVNLNGTRLLGVERSRLVNRRFGLFVAESDRRDFNAFLAEVFASRTRVCCEVALAKEGHPPTVVRIEGMVSEDGQECRAVALDLTERRQAEEQMRAAQAETLAAAEALALEARISSIFLTAHDDELFHEVLELVLDDVHSPLGAFGYLDEAGALVVPTMKGPVWDKCQMSGKTITFPRESWGDSNWPRAIREKRTLHSNEPSSNLPQGHFGIQRHVCVPILFQGEVVGLFQVANKETAYTAADIRSLESIAGHVAPILSARLRRERVQEEIRSLNVDLEQRVLDRTTEIQAANQELDAYSYSVSHDLRAPLRAIDGYAGILREDHTSQLDAEGQRILAVIAGEVARMEHLIDDLLAFSRLGRGPLARSLIDMEAMARTVFAELAGREPGRTLRLALEPLPPARGDPAMLRQVWVNLLANAIKYTSTREVAQIRIGSRTEAGETTYLVQDNGVGFDMKYVRRLFGVFQRLHTEAEFTGTGVGLALVRRILVRHGGRVWVDAAIDAGATFFFTLPAIASLDGKTEES